MRDDFDKTQDLIEEEEKKRKTTRNFAFSAIGRKARQER